MCPVSNRYTGENPSRTQLTPTVDATSRCKSWPAKSTRWPDYRQSHHFHTIARETGLQLKADPLELPKRGAHQ